MAEEDRSHTWQLHLPCLIKQDCQVKIDIMEDVVDESDAGWLSTRQGDCVWGRGRQVAQELNMKRERK